MKIIILLGLLGATLSAPLNPQRLMSASNSNELLLNLNNGQLLPLQIQGPFNSWIPTFSGLLQQQQQAQIPGRPQFSFSSLDQFAGLFPDQIPFSRVVLSQGTGAGQLDSPQPPTPSQTQQGPNHVMPYVVSVKMPQEQTQMLQYYPFYMLLPWEQTQQTIMQAPQQSQQTGQQQFEEQIPLYPQFGYIPQQAEPGIPGEQQQSAFDVLLGTAPKTVVMPGGEVLPFLQKEVINFRPGGVGVYMPSTSPKPTPANFLTSATGPTIAPVLPKEKRKE